MAKKKEVAESTAVVVLTPEVIEQPFEMVLANTKIEVPLAQQHAAAFAPSMRKFHDYAAVLATIDRENPTTEDSAKARRARLDIAKVRTGAEIVKDERKAVILIESNLIQDLYNVVKNTCALTEAELLQIEKTQERKETERLNTIQAERMELLAPYDADCEFLDLKNMDQEQFDKFLNRSKLAHERETELNRLAEEKRVQEEKAAEEKRIADEAAAELERKRVAEENEKLRLENERLAAEKKEAERLAKIESDRLAAEQKKKDAAAKLELDNIKKLADAKENMLIKIREQVAADKKLAEQKEAEEKKRLQDIEDKRIADEKAAALAPDRKKMRAFFDMFIAIEAPELTSKEGKELAIDIKIWLGSIKTKMITGSAKLK